MAAGVELSHFSALATRLADMKAIQALMISNQRTLMESCSSDREVANRLADMIRDDEESLTALNNAMTNLGVSAEPQDKTTQAVEALKDMMHSGDLTLFDKALQHEGLKHQLVMTGITVYKAAQTVGGNLQETIDPVNQVNFKNRAHQEQMKSILITLGTREMVNQEPDQSIWAQTEDAIASLKGIFGGLAS
ncbi:MAG: hemerythrin HHE cation-binding protein [Elainellaceae cyanobacterium]